MKSVQVVVAELRQTLEYILWISSIIISQNQRVMCKYTNSRKFPMNFKTRYSIHRKYKAWEDKYTNQSWYITSYRIFRESSRACTSACRFSSKKYCFDPFFSPILQSCFSATSPALFFFTDTSILPVEHRFRFTRYFQNHPRICTYVTCE